MLTQISEPFKYLKEGTSNQATYAWFRCNCGVVKLIRPRKVAIGDTKSCGCLNRKLSAERMSRIGKEHGAANGRANKTHGASAFGACEEFKVWAWMMKRCYDFNKKTYHQINVCPRWANSPQAFLEDMGPRPSKDHQIDRIDSKGDYCPENCRWLHKSENRLRALTKGH